MTLDDLSAAIAGMYPEPWRWRNFGGNDVLVADHGGRNIILANAETRHEEKGILVPAAKGSPNMDGIALLRNCADELVAVAKEASHVEIPLLLASLHGDLDHQSWLKGMFAQHFEPLNKALASLQAKLSEIEL
jgi:hypothetical protein